MKKILILTFLSLLCFAQTPPPPGGPDDSFSGPSGSTPIDSAAIALFMIAAIVGMYFLLKKNRTLLVK